jgi:hypothetical protein
MADPRTADLNTIHGRVARFSQFYRAQRKAAKQGLVVNACPFGCEHDDLDDLGYCCHLVGFTSDRLTLERLDAEPKPGKEKRAVDGQKTEAVRRTDKLVRITNNYRVYREKVEPWVAPPAKAKRAPEPEPEGDEVDLPDEELEKLTRPDDTLRPVTHNGKSLS